ncbi:hypothetical protein [Clavibacter californiensis]|uniref:Secreted protein n=1 Tax=Clavibacter californiensis TaxID=1401995 RepID=A0ABX9N906_9MICO|nr:hypothetical protein [Clavibacter californiensis]PPF55345.1 hypothetical protein C5C13_12395 [Clavibacter michiganensis]RII94469.1 hypothetical protein DZF98_01445 [Clavibacter californiensis]UKF79171.1 hypothetical protein FGD68_10190 [Clavibacter californiensis]
MNRSTPALVIAGALVLGSALVATPAQATPGDGTVYSVPFDQTLFRDVEGADGFEVEYVTYDEWAAAGFPRPVAAEVDYHKYTWSPAVYADVVLEGAATTLRLTYDQYASVGSPKPSDDTLTAEAAVIKYAYSDELYLVEGTYLEEDPGLHKLTYREWAHLGSPAVDQVSDSVFSKLAWFPAIVGPTPQTGEVAALTLDEWDYFARPTPQIVKSFDGDRFCKAAGSADIRYVGIAAPKGAKLSYAQWREAGFPAPARC